MNQYNAGQVYKYDSAFGLLILLLLEPAEEGKYGKFLVLMDEDSDIKFNWTGSIENVLITSKYLERIY